MQWPEVAGGCLRCVYSSATQLSSAGSSSAFTQGCFSWRKLHLSRVQFIRLKSFPNLSIKVKKMCIFNTSVIAKLTGQRNKYTDCTTCV